MSNETFKIGEIAICVRPESPHYGREVTIVSALKRMRMWEGNVFTVCEVHEVDAPFAGQAPHGRWALEPKYLRKRRPPQDWVKLCNLTNIPREAVCDHEWIRAGRRESSTSLCLQCGVVNG